MASEAVATSAPRSQKWKLADAVIVGLVLLLVLVIGNGLRFSRGTLLPWTVGRTQFQKSQVDILIILLAQLGAAAALVLTRAKTRSLGGVLASFAWNPNKQLWMSAFVGFALAGVITLASRLMLGSTSRFPDGLAPVSILLYALTTVVVGPFIEECYFRGICFLALSEKVGNFGAAIVTALVFALYHPFALRRLGLVFLTVGLVLGMTRIKTRSVAACFVLHAAYNTGVLAPQLFIPG